MSAEERQHLWDDPKNVKRLIHVFWVACAIFVLLDFVVHRHGSFEEAHVVESVEHDIEQDADQSADEGTEHSTAPSAKSGILPFVERAEHWPAFYPVYGFVACVLLVLVAKQMRRVIGRSEVYYRESATFDASGLGLEPPPQVALPHGHGHGGHAASDGGAAAGEGHDG